MVEHNTSREQLDELLNEAIEMAQKLIAKHGSHMPFAMGIRPNGDRLNIAADDSETQEVDVLAETVLKRVRELCESRELTAVAFATNVDYLSAQDGSPTDAIEVTVDHIKRDAVTCYLPYSHTQSGDCLPGQLFATDPKHEFFKGLWPKANHRMHVTFDTERP